MKKIISIIIICILLILQIDLISYAEEIIENNDVSIDVDGKESEEDLNKEIEYNELVEMEKGSTVKDFIEKVKNLYIERAKKDGKGELSFGNSIVYKINGTTNRALKLKTQLKETDIVSTNMEIEMGIIYSNGVEVGEINFVATVVKGDVTGTGEVDVTSLSLMQQEIVRETELKGPYKEAADMNNDEEIDVLDLSAIQEEIIKD